MIILYKLLIGLYLGAVRLASLWNTKARKWLKGRKFLFEDLERNITPSDSIIWFHCSSAGEFEQGKPVMEELKRQFPSHKILVSFFSPSGYEVGKRYSYADFITYLPVDKEKNAQKFLQLAHPELVVFVKYDFWYYHLKAVSDHNIPLLLISASFRPNQVFFRSYGGFYRKMLFFFRHLFVQDTNSLHVLRTHNIPHGSVAGDTRFDRVKEIAANFSSIPLIDLFVDGQKTIVVGSTWHGDEQILSEALGNNTKIKLIIAPHEINEAHISSIEKMFHGTVRYSQIHQVTKNSSPNQLTNIKEKEDENSESNRFKLRLQEAEVLIIDNVGMLSRLYKYATISYIGGGFTKDGIHNTLEAAVYGKPVLFGPNYAKYREAKELIACGGAFSVATSADLTEKLKELMTDADKWQRSGNAAFSYVQDNTGATKKIVDFIQENRLLTR